MTQKIRVDGLLNLVHSTKIKNITKNPLANNIMTLIYSEEFL